MKKPDGNPEAPKNEQETSEGRRKLLKLLAAGTGAFAAATVLPMRWTKPLVEMGVLPAHAQMSGPRGGDLQVSMSWINTGTNSDHELHIVDPQGGTDVFGGNTTSATLTHNGDAPNAPSGSESAGNTTPGMVAAGTYQIYLRNVWAAYNTPGRTLTVDVTVNGSTTPFNLDQFFFTGNPDSRRIADVTFPAGTLTDRSGQPYP